MSADVHNDTPGAPPRPSSECPDCDDGHADELLPPHRNPDDSLTRRVPCPTCDGACEVPE